MSLELSALGLAGQAQGQNELLTAINELRREIRLLRDFTPQPFVFLKVPTEVSSNVANNILIVAGQPVPAGHRATVKDFNLIFGTAAGTVKIVTLDPSGNVLQKVLEDVTSDANGIGETVLDEGERLAVVGQSAGAGTFTVYCTGSKQRFREEPYDTL